MTPEQLSNLITCCVLVIGMSIVTWLHFRGVKNKPKNHFERMYESYCFLRSKLNHASWSELKFLHEQVLDFAQEYAGRVDSDVLTGYTKDLVKMHDKRAKQVRPKVGTVVKKLS